jgi:hypothetical protein
MVRKIISLTLAFLAVLGLAGCGSGHTLKGSIVMLEGQSTPKDRIKVWVVRVGSNEDGALYEVDDRLRFSVELTEDGEYLIEGVVINDPGFYTKQVRVVVKNGRIEDNKTHTLQFELMNVD